MIVKINDMFYHVLVARIRRNQTTEISRSVSELRGARGTRTSGFMSSYRWRNFDVCTACTHAHVVVISIPVLRGRGYISRDETISWIVAAIRQKTRSKKNEQQRNVAKRRNKRATSLKLHDFQPRWKLLLREFRIFRRSFSQFILEPMEFPRFHFIFNSLSLFLFSFLFL